MDLLFVSSIRFREDQPNESLKLDNGTAKRTSYDFRRGDLLKDVYRRERRRDTYSLVDGSEGLEREGGHYDVGRRTDYKAKIRCQLDRKKGTDSKIPESTEVLWNEL